ncbi:MAG: hypothetical protein P8H65_06430 [Rhodothermales bacterium]|jgi:hypothetical protein|nr:hypothetical protein [Rhodothermales bacterium]MDG2015541.1 hypothetical protein [Rhodothermales bacterium]HAY36308.1 hypothetical protein [Bacteroidota bacterium]
MSESVKRSNPLMWFLDPLTSTASQSDPEYRYSWSKIAWMLPLAIGILGLVVTAIGWATNSEQFYYSYLIGWAFCLSITIGAYFFVVIQHLTKARWSVVIRRIPEALIWSFPLLAVLSIPILLGMHDLYHWTHHDLFDPASANYDPVIAGKEAYLNTPFFLARFAFYFLSWTWISYKLYTLSVRQDNDPHPEIAPKQRKYAAIGLALGAITTAFAAFDILMSLDPHWFSTIFGIYFFAGSFMIIMAVMALVSMMLQRKGMLTGLIKVDHYQDLGKFLFGFVVFWAYIGFSQYMLIWYGNLPEETVFYRHRLEHGWGTMSAILLIGHFIIPFIVLVGRWAKRNLALFGFMCIYMLVMHWFDFYWIVAPVLHEHVAMSIYDVTGVIGLFGVYSAAFMYRLSRHALVPQRDPRLHKSLSFTNT